MGIHKNFEKAYISYVAGCEEMIQSITIKDGVCSFVQRVRRKTGRSDRKYLI